MKIKSALSLFTALAFISGCNTMKVTSEHDQNHDFGKVKTYQWIAGPAKILDESDTYINEDIQQALNNELSVRGFRQVMDLADADVQISYYVKLKEELGYADPARPDEREFSGGFVYRRESSSWSYEEREPDLNVYAVEIGTLTVLVFDTETGERIWRGNLKTEIDRSQPQDRQQERIRKAAEKLMNHFPAKSE